MQFGNLYYDQRKLFDEKTRGQESRGTITLTGVYTSRYLHKNGAYRFTKILHTKVRCTVDIKVWNMQQFCLCCLSQNFRREFFIFVNEMFYKKCCFRKVKHRIGNSKFIGHFWHAIQFAKNINVNKFLQQEYLFLKINLLNQQKMHLRIFHKKRNIFLVNIIFHHRKIICIQLCTYIYI